MRGEFELNDEHVEMLCALRREESSEHEPARPIALLTGNPMSIPPISDFEHILVCPRCRAALTRDEDRYRCSNPSCTCGGASGFAVVGSWPVLVDFQACILDRHEVLRSRGASPVRRSSVTWVRQKCRRILFGRNPVAQANLARLVDLLPGIPSRPKVLVIGGGAVGNGAQALYEDDRVDVIGFDIYGSALTQFVADAHRIPIASESVQGVLVQAVLEHVLDPWQVAGEIHRVLAPDGVVYAETPFMQQVHEGAYDFTRFTDSGQRYLFRRFEVIDSGAVAGPGTQLVWSVDHLARCLFRSKVVGRACGAAFAWLRILDPLCSTKHAIDAASCVYFLGRKVGGAITPRQIVEYYRGAQR